VTNCGKLSAEGEVERKPVILLADDNADMREYVTSLLDWRFQVVQAENGKAAFVQAQQLAPDLVLTDVMMPEMDGFELLEALRQIQTLDPFPLSCCLLAPETKHASTALKQGPTTT